MKEYSQALKTLRKHFGLTQKELAKRLFVSDKTLSKWENGVTQPDISALRAVCESYGITTEQFFAIAAGSPVEEVLATPAQPKPIRTNKRWAILLSAIAATALGVLAVFIGLLGKNDETVPAISAPPNHIVITYLVDGEQYGYEIYEKDSYVDYPEPYKHGQVFQGWYTEKKGGLLYDFKRVQTSAILHARFRPIRYTAVFQDPENSSNNYTVSLESGQKWQFPNGFTREGYDFVGWANKYNAVYTAGEQGVDLWEYDGSTVYLRAVWKLSESVKPTYYTVYFFMTEGSYGGTGMGNGSRKQYGVEWTLPECTAKRTGYLFVGYKWGKNYYSPGDTFLLDLEDASSSTDNSVEFSFQWRPITFYINYESELHENKYQESFRYNGNNYLESSWYGDTLEEYTLIGWEINGKVYEPHQKIGNLTATHGATFTAKAIWEFGTPGLFYKLTGDTYMVTDYSRFNEKVFIPDTHLGKAVTAISSNAFENCIYTTSVFIGNNITSIGEGAFKGCEKLTSITVSEKNEAYMSEGGNLYTKDGKTLVQYAVGKTKTSFTVLSGVTVICGYAFYNSEYLTEIIFPDSVTVIGDYACNGIKGLTKIVIPDCVTAIGDYTFSNCSSLADIRFPEGLTSIGDFAFWNCSSLTNATISEGTTNRGEKTFEDGNFLTGIGAYAFANCNTLTSIEIPDGITDIGASAFINCISLTSIEIPDGVTSIGNGAFEYCRRLTNVVIGDGVTSIGNNAFHYCNNLISIVLGSGVSYIDSSAFYNCDKLVEVVNKSPHITVKKGSTDNGYVGYYALVVYNSGDAFESKLSIKDGYIVYTDGEEKILIGYEGKETDLVLPSSITQIYKYAFRNCENLTSVVIGDGVTSIGEQAFFGCSGLKSVAVGDGVTSIDKKVFESCKNLTNVTMGKQVTNIGEQAFINCSSLTNIEIPDGVTGIGSGVFWCCSSLMGIRLPDGLTSIGNNAFWNCSSLKEIIIPDSVTSIGGSAFGYCKALTSVVIGNRLTSIGNNAFWNCSSLTEIIIPDGVTSIDSGAFSYCSSLKEIIIPDSVTDIGYFAFTNCINLTNVVIGDGVTSIGYNAFCYCKNLISVVLGNHVKSIGSDVFNHCDRLVEVVNKSPHITVKKGSKDNGYVGYYALAVYNSGDAFESKLSIKDGYIVYTDGEEKILIGYIGKETDLVLLSSITQIYKYAFRNCTNLTSVVIGDGVMSIGYAAFEGCSSLTSITFKDPSDWYYTIYTVNWENKVYGTKTDVTDASTNAKYFTDTYVGYYWYKL